MHFGKLLWRGLIFLWMCSSGHAQHRGDDSMATTEYFEFHSNYWINLHHFLYQKASGSQLRKLKEDGNQYLEIGEDKVQLTLSAADEKTLSEAISYYKDSIISKSLLFDLGQERVWLQRREAGVRISDTTFSKRYTEILNKVSPVYSKHFWPLHEKQNAAILKLQLPSIKRFERTVITKMEGFAMKKWPVTTKVRVDVSAYANYAGAYTPTRPRFNIFISSLDPSSEKMDFVETILHEGSHLLFNYGGPFREGIALIFDQKKLEIPYPKQLWHAALFYLCGRSVQDELQNNGYTEYRMIMDTRTIFSSYNTKVFRAGLEQYYQDKTNFNNTIAQLLDGLK